MSWAAYLDRLGPIAQGYIIGKNGDVWGTPTNKSPQQKATAEELKDICVNMEKWPESGYFQANGIRLGGIKFFALDHEEFLLKGKCKQDSVVIRRCKQCIIIAHSGPDVQIADLNGKVWDMGEHLAKSGF